MSPALAIILFFVFLSWTWYWVSTFKELVHETQAHYTRRDVPFVVFYAITTALWAVVPFFVTFHIYHITT